ncbi:outer membrane protein A, partial [Alcaligenes faecalis subsp. faecalis NCIB 8687]
AGSHPVPIHRAVSGQGFGTNELCWRNNFWTPATGIPGCDGVPVAQAPEAPVVAPTVTKVTLNADTFFDFPNQTLALIAHDALKEKMVDFASKHFDLLSRFGQRVGTGTTVC